MKFIVAVGATLYDGHASFQNPARDGSRGGRAESAANERFEQVFFHFGRGHGFIKIQTPFGRDFWISARIDGATTHEEF